MVAVVKERSDPHHPSIHPHPLTCALALFLSLPSCRPADPAGERDGRDASLAS